MQLVNMWKILQQWSVIAEAQNAKLQSGRSSNQSTKTNIIEYHTKAMRVWSLFTVKSFLFLIFIYVIFMHIRSILQ